MTHGSKSDGQVPEVFVPRLHRAARVEDAVHDLIEPRLRQRGWRDTIIPYTGYGTPTWVRVMARLLLRHDPQRRPERVRAVRGWRNFATLPVTDETVVIDVGDRQHEVRTDRSGYIDVVVDACLEPGWRSVRLQRAGAKPVEAPVRIVDPDVRLAVVSDIDDTVMVTTLPRPLLAAWNTFVLDEYARSPVPGMAVLYERLVTAYPNAPVFYLSTGAWNAAPTLTRFLSRNLYPPGPLLLTDWGPTTDRWFRSGQTHKRVTLERLAREFPDIRWLLIGDDGQRDQRIYSDFAAAHPDNVAAVAIRQLSATQSVLAGGLQVPVAAVSSRRYGRPWMAAPDGAGLAHQLSEAGLL
ncbi:MAG TPA: phosphatase domain-containing protein [Pseudonocardia sp.]